MSLRDLKLRVTSASGATKRAFNRFLRVRGTRNRSLTSDDTQYLQQQALAGGIGFKKLAAIFAGLLSVVRSPTMDTTVAPAVSSSVVKTQTPALFEQDINEVQLPTTSSYHVKPKVPEDPKRIQTLEGVHIPDVGASTTVETMFEEGLLPSFFKNYETNEFGEYVAEIQNDNTLVFTKKPTADSTLIERHTVEFLGEGDYVKAYKFTDGPFVGRVLKVNKHELEIIYPNNNPDVLKQLLENKLKVPEVRLNTKMLIAAQMADATLEDVYNQFDKNKGVAYIGPKKIKITADDVEKALGSHLHKYEQIIGRSIGNGKKKDDYFAENNKNVGIFVEPDGGISFKNLDRDSVQTYSIKEYSRSVFDPMLQSFNVFINQRNLETYDIKSKILHHSLQLFDHFIKYHDLRYIESYQNDNMETLLLGIARIDKHTKPDKQYYTDEYYTEITNLCQQMIQNFYKIVPHEGATRFLIKGFKRFAAYLFSDAAHEHINFLFEAEKINPNIDAAKVLDALQKAFVPYSVTQTTAEAAD